MHNSLPSTQTRSRMCTCAALFEELIFHNDFDSSVSGALHMAGSQRTPLSPPAACVQIFLEPSQDLVIKMMGKAHSRCLLGD